VPTSSLTSNAESIRAVTWAKFSPASNGTIFYHCRVASAPNMTKGLLTLGCLGGIVSAYGEISNCQLNLKLTGC
jgi:hypothetical protein